MHKLALLLPVLCLSIQTALCDGHGPGKDAPPPWLPVLDWLRAERDRMSGDLETAHSKLLARALAAGEQELVERLSPEAPRPRPVGYGILPEVRDDEPVEPRTPRETSYSLESLSNGFPKDFRDAAILAGRSATDPDLPLEPAVDEFERLRKRMRNLEDHLDYHKEWQVAAVANRGFFKRQNRSVELVREMEKVRQEGGEAEQIERLHAEVVDRVTSFSRAPDLSLTRRPDGTRVLPVTVWTDIEDPVFLDRFREIVEGVFTDCAAARSMRFALELRLRRIPVAELYPKGPPARGAAIDISEHQDRFPGRRLILTTGAESTHAWQGRSVLLGSAPLSRNTLAHEFAHLLGFGDAYLRGFDGEPGGPFGVVFVEWTGLENDLMGWPAGGAVSERMIAKLIEAYGDD